MSQHLQLTVFLSPLEGVVITGLVPHFGHITVICPVNLISRRDFFSTLLIQEKAGVSFSRYK